MFLFSFCNAKVGRAKEGRGARFYLDKDHRITLFGDNVYFAEAASVVSLENLIAVSLKEPDGFILADLA